jgi:hypothetical protein
MVSFLVAVGKFFATKRTKVDPNRPKSRERHGGHDRQQRPACSDESLAADRRHRVVLQRRTVPGRVIDSNHHSSSSLPYYRITQLLDRWRFFVPHFGIGLSCHTTLERFQSSQFPFIGLLLAVLASPLIMNCFPIPLVKRVGAVSCRITLLDHGDARRTSVKFRSTLSGHRPVVSRLIVR